MLWQLLIYPQLSGKHWLIESWYKSALPYWFCGCMGLYPSCSYSIPLGLRTTLRVQIPYILEAHGTTITYTLIHLLFMSHYLHHWAIPLSKFFFNDIYKCVGNLLSSCLPFRITQCMHECMHNNSKKRLCSNQKFVILVASMNSWNVQKYFCELVEILVFIRAL